MATQNYDNIVNNQTSAAIQAAPTGLINTPGAGWHATGTASKQAPASTYTGAQAAAANWAVQPNQTVQSQVRDIINDNSPLMEQAETRALQKANARGLINSSIAVGAGQSALYDAAMPIATQDASRLFAVPPSPHHTLGLPGAILSHLETHGVGAEGNASSEP